MHATKLEWEKFSKINFNHSFVLFGKEKNREISKLEREKDQRDKRGSNEKERKTKILIKKFRINLMKKLIYFFRKKEI